MPVNHLTASMVRLSRFMFYRGVTSYVDFREGGVEGAKALAAARGNGAEPVIMARPAGMKYVPDEIDALLKVANGIAVSSISDWDYGELQRAGRTCEQEGRPLRHPRLGTHKGGHRQGAGPEAPLRRAHDQGDEGGHRGLQ